MVTWHVGPYEKLPKAYEAFDEWSKENQFSPSKPPMEIYWSDPGEEPDSSKWRTELIFPL